MGLGLLCYPQHQQPIYHQKVLDQLEERTGEVDLEIRADCADDVPHAQGVTALDEVVVWN